VSAERLAARQRAMAAAELGRANEAVRFAKEAIAADPTFADSYCVLAYAYGAAARNEDSLGAADEAIARDPRAEWAHALRAQSLFRTNRPKDALASVDEALKLAPGLAQRHRQRAYILAKLGRADDAWNEAVRARELAPHDALSHDVIGDLSFAAKEYVVAEEAWREALRIDPTSAMRLNNMGAALANQGRREEAREAYRHAIRLDPSLAISKRNLHENVSAALGKGVAVAGGAAVGGLKFCGAGVAKYAFLGNAARVATQGWGPNWLTVLLWIVLVLVLGGLAVKGVRILRARRLEKELEERDPELMRIYRQIDADLAAGRLRSK
jgi:tetratricopeptide (TPR) repeat protein